MRLLLLLLLLAPGAARADTLAVLTTGAYRAVLVALAPGVEKATGHTLRIENETAGVVAQRLRQGQAFDLVMLPPDAAQALGPLLGPATPLAKVGIGVAVRDGAPKPDIATAEAVRASVLAARAPAWIDPASGGSSGIYLHGLFQKWGILAEIAPRAVLVQGGLVADKIASGAADLGFQQMSELNHTPGVSVVGLLPDAIQNDTVYAGAVPANAPHPQAAAAILALLAGPEARATLPAKGMQAP